MTAKPLCRDEVSARQFAVREEETKMPEITISMAAGRTDEQKVGMMRDITQALVKNLGVDAEAVVIQINEAPLVHKMKGGVSFVERFGKK
ncbi:MAG: tautomerase family protein [Bradyrhizobium sp.]